MAKVHVIGAGPAGSIASISSVREGHNVILSEEHKTAGIPENCSGLFSKSGLENFSSYVNYKKHVINEMRGASISFAGEEFTVRANRAMGYVCRRAEFDQDLALTAESEGVKVHYNERITNTFHASNIIGADGPHSIVANYFKMGKINRHISTLHATCNYPVHDSHIVYVYLDTRIAPGFFAWVIPHDEETAEIAVGVSLPHSVSDSWKKFLKFINVKNAPKPKGAVIPAETRPKTALSANGKNVLLVGDAAGQVKATTGGGVIYGAQCAMIAGRNISSPLFYEFEWKAKLGTDILLHRFINDFISSKSNSQLRWIGRKLRNMRFDEYLSKHGSMDSPSSMIKPQAVVHMIKNIMNKG